jgi:DNA helicase-2/ATP-dependent DNA helicase PcrA
MRFFERAEIKHALAYLRLVATPDDDGALLRGVNFPPRGIGARPLEQLQDQARGRGTSLWQVACAGTVGGKAGTSVAAFVRLIEGMRAVTALPLAETVEHVVEASGLLAHYRQEKEGQERIENLEELVNAAASFVREADLAVDAPIRLGRNAASEVPAEAVLDDRAGNDVAAAPSSAPGVAGEVAPAAAADGAPDEGATDELTAFLAHAALEAGDTQAAEGRSALQLMTVHAAKGLEFHTVFVTGLEEGLFPHENSLNVPDGVEEERRLMYVAITRARRRLYLTHAQTRMLHGQTRYNIVSRFLAEIPRELVQWLSPQPSRRSAFSVDHAEWGDIHAAPQATPPAPSWRIGQSVRHAKFGVGVIINAEGRGSDARVQVNFRDTGVKWLALDYAKLERA